VIAFYEGAIILGLLFNAFLSIDTCRPRKCLGLSHKLVLPQRPSPYQGDALLLSYCGVSECNAFRLASQVLETTGSYFPLADYISQLPK
jgi:hypothetical protein